MLNIVVPLAGPDFENPDGSVKAEHSIGASTLLEATLGARPWLKVEHAPPIFVLLDRPASRRFADQVLSPRFPGANFAWLGAPTSGAAFSAAAGAALVKQPDAPLVIDLCDILFDCPIDVAREFAARPDCGALAPTFESRSPAYSYLRLDEAGDVIEAREKVVISSHASAGVYMFRNVETFWAALSFGLRNRERLTYNGALYVCPLLNGVVDRGQRVRTIAASNVVDVKTAHAG